MGTLSGPPAYLGRGFRHPWRRYSYLLSLGELEPVLPWRCVGVNGMELLTGLAEGRQKPLPC